MVLGWREMTLLSSLMACTGKREKHQVFVSSKSKDTWINFYTHLDKSTTYIINNQPVGALLTLKNGGRKVLLGTA
jgi:CRISPR/Cas system CSM-associated protein Csm5 (group 7 of RAMP superfamily)